MTPVRLTGPQPARSSAVENGVEERAMTTRRALRRLIAAGVKIIAYSSDVDILAKGFEEAAKRLHPAS